MHMEPIAILGLFVVCCALVIPATFYMASYRTGIATWGLVFHQMRSRGTSAYRRHEAPTYKPGAAPWVVRIAALSSFFLGQMIVPGAFAALIGMLYLLDALGHMGREPMVLVISALSAPTGLVVAGYLLAAGTSLLQREPRASSLARRASTWALAHNILLVTTMVAAMLGEHREVGYGLFCCGYASLSIAQALLLRSAASSLDAYTEAQVNHPAPDDAQVVVS